MVLCLLFLKRDTPPPPNHICFRSGKTWAHPWEVLSHRVLKDCAKCTVYNFEPSSNSQRTNPGQTHTAAFSVSEPLFVCSYFVRSTKVSEGKEAGKWKTYLHAIRLLKINPYDAVLTSQIQTQMRAEIQALEDSPLKKKAIIRFHFRQCLLLLSPLAKKLKASQACSGRSDRQHANSAVLILTKKVTILGVPTTPGI